MEKYLSFEFFTENRIRVRMDLYVEILIQQMRILIGSITNSTASHGEQSNIVSTDITSGGMIGRQRLQPTEVDFTCSWAAETNATRALPTFSDYINTLQTQFTTRNFLMPPMLSPFIHSCGLAITIVTTIILLTMFTVQSSWQRHCERSYSSSNKCKTVPSNFQLSDQVNLLGQWLKCYHLVATAWLRQRNTRRTSCIIAPSTSVSAQRRRHTDTSVSV